MKSLIFLVPLILILVLVTANPHKGPHGLRDGPPRLPHGHPGPGDVPPGLRRDGPNGLGDGPPGLGDGPPGLKGSGEDHGRRRHHHWKGKCLKKALKSCPTISTRRFCKEFEADVDENESMEKKWKKGGHSKVFKALDLGGKCPAIDETIPEDLKDTSPLECPCENGTTPEVKW
jgi:hypothetical protein